MLRCSLPAGRAHTHGVASAERAKSATHRRRGPLPHEAQVGRVKVGAERVLAHLRERAFVGITVCGRASLYMRRAGARRMPPIPAPTRSSNTPCTLPCCLRRDREPPGCFPRCDGVAICILPRAHLPHRIELVVLRHGHAEGRQDCRVLLLVLHFGSRSSARCSRPSHTRPQLTSARQSLAGSTANYELLLHWHCAKAGHFALASFGALFASRP